ncbi:MAG: hypothetical protein LBK73_00380 [Treponema sp.]|nr:hypothetical protein [Treponema sp.]
MLNTPPPPPYCLKATSYTKKNNNHYTSKLAISVSIFLTRSLCACLRIPQGVRRGLCNMGNLPVWAVNIEV